jgi:peptidoglycan/xylan/chitin deacetylase (PgdA/CDA1 family)
MNALRKILHRLQKFLPVSSDGVVILSYHLVGAGTSLRVDIDEHVFQRQMNELKGLAEVVSLHKAIDALRNGAGIKKPLAVIFFDDAYENFYEKAWPILHELSISVTLFVPVGFVERETGPPISETDGLHSVSWKQLDERVTTGLLNVGSHGWSHLDMRKLSGEESIADLVRSRQKLEDRLGINVDCFSYPRGLWSRRAELLVGEVYDLATLGGARWVTPSNFNPLRLWRLPITRDMPSSLSPVFETSVWLEEWFADKWRRCVR